MTKLLLLFVRLLLPLVRRSGIDARQFYAILEVKLTLDTRRPTPGLSQGQSSRNAFGWTLFLYAIMGLMMGGVIWQLPFLISMTLFFSYIMVMVAMTLILDFSTVLLDTSDNTIILPRPVNSRTFAAARLTHIILYVGLITLSLSFFSIAAVVYRYPGWLIPAFLVAIILSTLIGVFLTTTGYLAALRFASEEKVKTIINGAQVAMAVLFMGGYQLMPRLMNTLEMADGDMTLGWWSYLVPPMWMSGALQAISNNNYAPHQLVLSALAIVVPLTLVYITFTRLTPLFNKRLVSLSGNAQTGAVKPSGYADRMARLFARYRTEQGAFSFVFTMLGRDNRLKLKIYPTIGYVFIFGFIFIFNGKDEIVQRWHTLADTRYFILLLYLPVMVSQTALREIPFSDEFKASWIFQASPTNRPGEILSGMAKATVVKLLIPLYLVISVLVFGIWGVPVIDDIIFAMSTNYLIVWLMLVIESRMLPLSWAPNMRAQAGGFVRGLLMLLATAVPATGHYFLSFVPWSLYLTAPLVIALIYYLHQEYLTTPWSKIKL